ncbi:NADPH dependent preQ0 reductase [Klebsiella pneumoniae]|nr:NADPH dependent preQ0 reductase [Klebsiella pneumoniae]
MLRKNGETQCFISGPQESFWLVQADNITSRCLESQIEKHLLACLPQGVKDITIRYGRKVLVVTVIITRMD